MTKRLLLVVSMGCLISLSYSEEKSLRAAFPLDALTSVSEADARVTSDVLLREITEELGYSYNSKILQTHQQFLPQMKAGEFDFFLMFAYQYLNHRDEIPIKPILIGTRTPDSPLNRFCLLVDREGGLEAARGRRLLIQKGTGTLSRMWLKRELHQRGLGEVEDFFGKIEEVGNAGKAALPVFFGNAGAAITAIDGIDLLAELNPQINQKLERVATSPDLLRSVLCVMEDYPESDQEVIRKTGLALHETTKGEQILTLMHVKQLMPYDPDYIESLEQLLKDIGAIDREQESKTVIEDDGLTSNETDTHEKEDIGE